MAHLVCRGHVDPDGFEGDLRMTEQQEAAMRMALEALARYSGIDQRACDAEEALTAALEQPAQQERYMKAEGPLHVVCQCDQCKAQQEPVGEVNRYGRDSHGREWHGIHWYDPNVDVPHGTKLYTRCQARDPEITDWQERAMVAEAALAKLLDEKQEPAAVVSGYYGGKCVILPIDPARIFNSNTALYTRPQAREPLTFDGMTAQEFALKELYAFQEATGCDTADQIKAREPLTDEQIMDLCRSLPTTQYTTAFARAIEAAHGIKGDA